MPQIHRLTGYAALEQRAINPSLRLFIATGNPKQPERELALSEAMGMVERHDLGVYGVWTWYVPPEPPCVRD